MPTSLRLGLERFFSSSGGLLTLLLFVALTLRLYGVEWDQGGLYHPDERQILMTASRLELPADFDEFLDPDKSPLNPHFFAYGSMPMYVLEGTTAVWENLTDSQADLTTRANIGRVISSIADTVTILLVFLLGRRLYNERVGLLAAMLTAFTVLHVQLAHFFTVDTPLTTLTIATLYFSARLMQSGRLRDGMLAGLFLGLTVATKTSAAPLALAVLFAWVVYYGRRPGTEDEDGPVTMSATDMPTAIIGALTSGAVAAITFAVTQPYFLLDFESFRNGVFEQAQMARGVLDWPFTRQFIGTTPFWFHIQQLAVWGMGLPLGIAAWGGFALAVWRGARRRRAADLLLLSWVVVYLLLTAGLQVKFMRYMLPITPILALFAAVALLELRRFTSARLFRIQIAEWAIALVVGLSFLYAVSYVNIYSTDHPATRMADWIQENVPKGSTVAQEHWDEPLRGLPESGYRVPNLPLYEVDNAFKARQIAEILDSADYVAIFSQRLYVSTYRLEERYPMTRLYYEMLFNGELGFDAVRIEASYPNFFGLSLVNNSTTSIGLAAPEAVTRPVTTPLSIDMGFVQESFIAYDHPKVLLFQKTNPMSTNEYTALLLPAVEEAAFGLKLTSEQQEVQTSGGTWSEIFDPESLANRFPVVVWYLAFQAMVLMVLPLGLLLFRPLPDRGYLLIKVLALALVAYVPWMLSSTSAATFSRGTVLLGMLALASLSIIALLFKRDEIAGFLRERWRFITLNEALFLVAFLAFVWIRAANPDLWHPFRGGEKPMDFAYLNAIVRSSSLPPADPWFAGGYINYYYFGQFMVATLIRLTSILPEVAYNLAVPTFFALTFGAAFSVTYNLVELARRAMGSAVRSSRAVIGVAVLGGLFVAVAGNVDGIIQWGRSSWQAVQYVQEVISPQVSDAGGGLFDVAQETFSVWREDRLFREFDFWRSSRMIPGIHITEFPFFTFLFADLHAHMMALPFTILALGLALSLAQRVREWSRSQIAGMAATFVVLGLILGLLWATNAWDYPTYMAISAGAVGLAVFTKRRSMLEAVLGAAGAGLALLVLSRVLLLPYHDNFGSFYNGLRSSPFQTSPYNYAGVHGLFLFILFSLLAVEAFGRLRPAFSRMRAALVERRTPKAPPVPVLYEDVYAAEYLDAAPYVAEVEAAPASAPPTSVSRFFWYLGAIAVSFLLYVLIVPYIATDVPLLSVPADVFSDVVSLALEFKLVMMLAVLILAVTALILRGTQPLPHKFALAMVLVALGLGAGVDLVAVKGDIERMNTLFKFYLQAWVLFGIASAYLLWYLGHRGAFQGLRGSWGRQAWVAALGVFLFAVSIYPFAATPVRVNDRFQTLPLTLNGLAYTSEAVYRDEHGVIPLRDDSEAIEWLKWNVVGSPVIVEAVTPEYRWGGRVAIQTGLPTVLGWNWHQRQQRGVFESEVWTRQRAVERFYQTTDAGEALEFLREYGVEYVYLGQVERLYYEPRGMAKFAEMEGETLEVAHRTDDVTIYRVLPG